MYTVLLFFFYSRPVSSSPSMYIYESAESTFSVLVFSLQPQSIQITISNAVNITTGKHRLNKLFSSSFLPKNFYRIKLSLDKLRKYITKNVIINKSITLLKIFRPDIAL